MMTREEAKSCIKTIEMLRRLAYNIHGVMDVIDADNCEKIIKTLAQEPSGETVSLEAFKQVMWERDIAIDQLKELGYGFGQKIEPCGDAISREDLEECKELMTDVDGDTIYAVRMSYIRQLSSFNPQPKMGHWIEKDGYSDCSECGSHIVIEWNYCPKCGAKMVEPQESEE